MKLTKEQLSEKFNTYEYELEKENLQAYNESIGKKIKDVLLEKDELIIVFDDNKKIKIWDDGQNCCERRYMSNDGDEYDYYIDSKLLDIKVKNGPSIEIEYEEHDTQFLEIVTDKGSFTLSNHNEHNGYYGGFCINIEEIEGEDQ